MKSKIPTNLAKKASKLHKKIGKLLTSEDSIFKHLEIRQEYPANKVNPGFKSGREKYDWVILGQAVIEIMGRQHFEYIPYFHTTKYDFQRQLARDEAKKNAAIEAGYAYVTVKYNEHRLTLEDLTKRILRAIEEAPEAQEIDPIKPKAKIVNNSKLQSRGFQKPPEGYKYKWPKKKIKN